MATTTQIDLFLDLTNRKLVLGLGDATPFRLGDGGIYQGDQIPFRLWPIKPPTGLISASNPYLQIPTAGLSWIVGVGPRDGTEALLAKQDVWADSGQGYFTAILNLNTDPMNSAIGSLDTFPTYFEIYLAGDSPGRTVYQETIAIIPVVIGPTGSAALPAPSSQYYTAAQIDALVKAFVRYVNNPNGATIELLCLSGAHSRTLGTNDDGSAKDELV